MGTTVKKANSWNELGITNGKFLIQPQLGLSEEEKFGKNKHFLRLDLWEGKFGFPLEEISLRGLSLKETKGRFPAMIRFETRPRTPFNDRFVILQLRCRYRYRYTWRTVDG